MIVDFLMLVMVYNNHCNEILIDVDWKSTNVRVFHVIYI